MLLLNRRVGEVVTIGTGADAIRVKVEEIVGSRVRLAVDAPRPVRVARGEVVEAARLVREEVENE